MGSPFPAYTVADFMKEVVNPHLSRTGICRNMSCTLPISKYVSLCDYVWSGAAISSISVPGLDQLNIVIPSGPAKIAPSTDSGILLDHDGVLRELLRLGIGPVVEVGPYRYMCLPRPSVAPFAANAFPTTVFGSWQQPPDNLTPPQAAADPEPPCHCDSHKLATVGHDEYCAYILWKRRGGK